MIFTPSFYTLFAQVPQKLPLFCLDAGLYHGFFMAFTTTCFTFLFSSFRYLYNLIYNNSAGNKVHNWTSYMIYFDSVVKLYICGKTHVSIQKLHEHIQILPNFCILLFQWLKHNNGYVSPPKNPYDAPCVPDLWS